MTKQTRKYNLVVLVGKGVQACFDMGMDVTTSSLDEVVYALDDDLGWLVAARTDGEKWHSYLDTFDTRAINRHVQYHDIGKHKAWFAMHMPSFIKYAKNRGFAKLVDVIEGKITPTDYVSKPHAVDTIMYRGVSYPLEANNNNFIIRPVLGCKLCGADICGTAVVNFKDDGSLRGTQIFIPDDKSCTPAKKGSKHWLCPEHAVKDVTDALKHQYKDKFVDLPDVDMIRAIKVSKEAADELVDGVKEMVVDLLKSMLIDSIDTVTPEDAAALVRVIKLVKEVSNG